jgi:hypothetical protein
MSADPSTAAVTTDLDRQAVPARRANTRIVGRDVAPASAPGAREWPKWVLRPLVIFVTSRAVVFATLAITSLFTHKSIPHEIDRWDSRWFIRAALSGYPRHLPQVHGHTAGNTIAFFPLFPFLIRWVAHPTGFSLLSSGIGITVVTGLTALVAVWAMVRHYAGQDNADRATLLVALFPGSLALTLVYSEGLVLTFVALALLALMKRQWVLAGILGMFATATSPIALAFELSCLWSAYGAIRRDREWRSLAAPILAPLGFIGYQIWLWHHTGTLLAWRLTEKGGWNSYPSLRYPISVLATFVRDPVANTITGIILTVGTVAVVIGIVAAVKTKMPAPLLIYGVVAAFMAAISAQVGLRPRFIFLAFPLIIAVGVWLKGRSYWMVLVASALLLIGMTVLEVASWAVFP